METIIKIGTARLAAEKGFKWPCLYFWSEDDNEIYTYDTPMNWNYDTVDEHNSARYNAPSHARLQKWLREKHKIYIEIHLVSYHGDHDYEICRNGMAPFKGRELGSLYEECLEKALAKALELI